MWLQSFIKEESIESLWVWFLKLVTVLLCVQYYQLVFIDIGINKSQGNCCYKCKFCNCTLYAVVSDFHQCSLCLLENNISLYTKLYLGNYTQSLPTKQFSYNNQKNNW